MHRETATRSRNLCQ